MSMVASMMGGTKASATMEVLKKTAYIPISCGENPGICFRRD